MSSTKSTQKAPCLFAHLQNPGKNHGIPTLDSASSNEIPSFYHLGFVQSNESTIGWAEIMLAYYCRYDVLMCIQYLYIYTICWYSGALLQHPQKEVKKKNYAYKIQTPVERFLRKHRIK